MFRMRPEEEEYLKKRSESEPTLGTEQDITELSGLEPFAERIVKYTCDKGITWRYARLSRRGIENFPHQGMGIRTSLEVSQDGGHGDYPIMESDFQEGMVVRVVTEEEAIEKNITISYDFLRK